MKLLKIKTRNLNSLYGEHEVDLEGALGSAPIFLIMGPTGAGKSTLMDAISLALFGQTPRLRLAKTDTEPDEDCRNVMSRGTGDALAQVELVKLENGRPVRYRATWECHRSRKKAEGAFQDPVRTLERAVVGGEFEVVVSNKQVKVYGPAFEAFLEGMKVEDFKRSMLLAQGEFSAFLKADEDERGAILERLTNTSRFRDLGARAAHRKQQATLALKSAEDAIGNVQLLPEDQEAELRAQLEALAPRLDGLRKDRTSLDRFVTWRARLAELEKGHATAIEQLEAAIAERAARAGELTRLAEHERCAPASPALRDLERLRAEVAKVQAQLPPLGEEVVSLEAEAATAVSQQEACAKAAAEEAGRAAALAPALADARRLRTELTAAQAELDKATNAVSECSTETKRARAALAGLEQESAKTAEHLRIAEAAVQDVAASAPLIEALTGLQARHEALMAQRQALADRKKRHVKETRALSAAREALAALQKEHASASARLAEHEVECASARAALTALLACTADPSARRQAISAAKDALARRVQLLEGLARDAEAQAKAHSAALEKQAALEQVTAALSQLRSGLEAGAKQLAELETAQAAQQVELEDQRWMKSVALERKRLHAGAECPLCGGTEHPYLADGRHADVDARVEARCAVLEAELARRAESIEAARGALDGRRREEASLGTRAEGLREDLARLNAELAELSRVLAGRTPESLRTDRAQADTEAGAIAAQLEQLDAADRAERAAAAALVTAQAELKALSVKLSSDEAAIRDVAARLETEANEEAAQAEKTNAEERALFESLAGFGIDAATGLDRAMAEATGLVHRVRVAQATLERTRAAAQNLEGDLQTARAQLSAAQEALAKAETELAARRARVDELAPRIAAALGGKSPEDVEAELTRAQAVATRALTEATRRATDLAQRLTAACTKLEQFTAQREELTKALGEATDAVGAKLRALGLGSERELSARILSDVEVSTLTTLRQRLDTAEGSLTRLREERLRDLEAHQQARPDAREEWTPLDEAGLHDSLDALDAYVEEEIRRQESIRGRLTEQDRARATLREKQAMLETAQRELDTWDRLHRLIGVGDGKAFQRYAQTLNLAELIARANQHLGTLAPRYELVRAPSAEGELPRLAFAIRDGFHAGEIRPINTLSGGETFLVSLALALGLAGYRTVKMPIETLLLDEGFGTLDPETLQVAMAALEALHASGTQVGIISHVEGLKERIPARVIVERTGAGRSTVRVEAA